MQARFLCVVLTHNHLPPPRKKLRIERCPLLPFTAHVLTDRLPRALHSSTSEVGPASHHALRAYFRSGWAFLIPYLAAYLLYAWLKWPVNPVAGGQWAVIPCLLHVYWALHAVHLVLGAYAVRTWWRASGATVAGATEDSVNAPNRAAQPQPLVSPKPRVGGSTGTLPPCLIPRRPASFFAAGRPL